MGISHPILANDDDLTGTVKLLLGIGYTLDELEGRDLTYMAAPRPIRPDTTIDPFTAFDFDHDPDFGRKAALALGFDCDAAPRCLPRFSKPRAPLFESTCRPSARSGRSGRSAPAGPR